MSGHGIEYRIGWSVHISGAKGLGEWAEFDGDATTVDGAREEIQRPCGASRLLEEAIEEAGFDCWVDVRAAALGVRSDTEGSE